MAIDTEPTMSDGDRARLSTYHREFFPGVAVYLVAVSATAVYVGDDGSMPKRLLLLLPLFPALWSVRAIVRALGRSDEFERTIHLESMSAGFGAAMIAAMTVGFLGQPGEATLFNQVTPWIVFSIGVLVWGVTVGVRTQRSRS